MGGIGHPGVVDEAQLQRVVAFAGGAEQIVEGVESAALDAPAVRGGLHTAAGGAFQAVSQLQAAIVHLPGLGRAGERQGFDLRR